MEIRRLHKNENELVSQLAQQLLRDHEYELGNDLTIIESYIYSIVSGNSSYIIIADDNGKIAGRTGLTFNTFIIPVHVEDGYQGIGLSKQLLNKILEDNINVECLSVSTILNGFYEKFGFKFVEEREVYHPITNNTKIERLYQKSLTKDK